MEAPEAELPPKRRRGGLDDAEDFDDTPGNDFLLFEDEDGEEESKEAFPPPPLQPARRPVKRGGRHDCVERADHIGSNAVALSRACHD